MALGQHDRRRHGWCCVQGSVELAERSTGQETESHRVFRPGLLAGKLPDVDLSTLSARRNLPRYLPPPLFALRVELAVHLPRRPIWQVNPDGLQ